MTEKNQKNPPEDNRPLIWELNLVLTDQEWCELQQQPFYLEMVKFLRDVGTQGTARSFGGPIYEIEI